MCAIFTSKVDTIIHPFNWKVDPISIQQWHRTQSLSEPIHLLGNVPVVKYVWIKKQSFHLQKHSSRAKGKLIADSHVRLWLHHPARSPEVLLNQNVSQGDRGSHIYMQRGRASERSAESRLHAPEEVLFILSSWKTSLQGCDLNCWQRLWPLHHIVR